MTAAGRGGHHRGSEGMTNETRGRARVAAAAAHWPPAATARPHRTQRRRRQQRCIDPCGWAGRVSRLRKVASVTRGRAPAAPAAPGLGPASVLQLWPGLMGGQAIIAIIGLAGRCHPDPCCTWCVLELEMKVHEKVRNHGEGCYGHLSHY